MAETQIETTAGELPASRMNLLQRIFGVIFSPGKTMENLIERPRIIYPLILAAVTQLALYLARFSLYEDFRRSVLIQSQSFVQGLSGVKMTPAMIDKQMSHIMLQTVISTPLGGLLRWIVGTVIFFAVFKIFGAKGKFKQFLSITGYAYTITALYYLIVLAVSFFTNSLYITLPLTSLANLLPANMAGSFLYGVATGLDIFSIWYICAIAIGMAAVSGFRKRNAYILVVVMYVIELLIAGFGAGLTKTVTGG